MLKKAPSNVELRLLDVRIFFLLVLRTGTRLRFQKGLELLCRPGPVVEDEPGDSQPIVAFRLIGTLQARQGGFKCGRRFLMVFNNRVTLTHEV